MSKKDLQAAHDKFNEKHTFSPGDFVEWKPGMANRKTAGPFIVSAMLPDPIQGSDETGDGYFCDMCDIKLANIDTGREGSSYVEYVFDSRRIQPVD